MTTSKDNGQVAEQTAATHRGPPNHDWFLAHIVALANDGVPTSITLHVGGLIVSGTMISGEEYFEEFGRLIRGANITGEGAEEAKETLARGFESFASRYRPPEGAGEDWAPPRPGFIHLREASVFSAAGNPIPQEGSLWRARLTAVDAFALGQLHRS